MLRNRLAISQEVTLLWSARTSPVSISSSEKRTQVVVQDCPPQSENVFESYCFILPNNLSYILFYIIFIIFLLILLLYSYFSEIKSGSQGLISSTEVAKDSSEGKWALRWFLHNLVLFGCMFKIQTCTLLYSMFLPL